MQSTLAMKKGLDKLRWRSIGDWVTTSIRIGQVSPRQDGFLEASPAALGATLALQQRANQ
jgi:hypothetical protein